MTLLDGHSRTPHDTLEQFLSGIAMLCCLPCLCVVKIAEKTRSSESSSRDRTGQRKEGKGVEDIEISGGLKIEK
ncbi:uncharacterized protein LY89DRAFT_323113 [Mollisia scopiformis]|uniref:Uncharacterized protein n=1 Tax=Mollisia scopiformis TaxID=149040 RepID=A0A132B8F5_MOLSC|nr:uncharacterized protein LY89DRAFT_323113 [Mollisia scopiformis]KUJ08682.1 hypothetical protein LY89DRAFT_323113 [Mollisia scopiformis]